MSGSHLCIPRNATVQPRYFQNRIIMFCLPIPTLIYLWEIYIFPGSVWEYINRSQTQCRHRDGGQTIPFTVIHNSIFGTVCLYGIILYQLLLLLYNVLYILPLPLKQSKYSPSERLREIGVLPCLAEEEEGDVRDFYCDGMIHTLVCQARSGQLPASGNSGC